MEPVKPFLVFVTALIFLHFCEDFNVSFASESPTVAWVALSLWTGGVGGECLFGYVFFEPVEVLIAGVDWRRGIGLKGRKA